MIFKNQKASTSCGLKIMAQMLQLPEIIGMVVLHSDKFMSFKSPTQIAHFHEFLKR